MKALDLLKAIKYVCPELWKNLDKAIEEIENLKHNYEMQTILIYDYKKELEALQNRSCDGCKYEDFKKEAIYYDAPFEPCRSCNRFAPDRYEAKENE